MQNYNQSKNNKLKKLLNSFNKKKQTFIIIKKKLRFIKN